MKKLMMSAASALIAASVCGTGFAAEGTCNWVASWASSQQLVEPRNELPFEKVADLTVRQTVRPSLSGERLRFRISNEFGDQPLRLGQVVLAEPAGPGSPAIVEGTAVTLTFGGEEEVTIPEGAAYYSDPVDRPVTAFEDVSVTIHIVDAPDPQSGHPGSRTTTHFLPGDHAEALALEGTDTRPRWYYIAALEVMPNEEAASVGVIGDSITDGYGSTTDGNDRWTDFLARRLAEGEATDSVAVLNFGLGGNRILRDGLGPNVLARVDRDILANPGLRHVILFEGINDIGGIPDDVLATEESRAAFADEMIDAMGQVIARAKGHGIKVYGATIAPFKGSGYYEGNPLKDDVRQRVNDWIRTEAPFDAVFDFDKVLQSKDDPLKLAAEMEVGDGLHPNPKGFEAIAGAVPLDLFAIEDAASCSR